MKEKDVNKPTIPKSYGEKSYYNNGLNKIKTGFVFSARGSKETEKPVAGQTGNNLDIMLGMLIKSHPEIFPSTNRYDYRITNAATSVHYEKLSNNTEASNNNIKATDNIDRVYHEIEDLDHLLLMGKKAVLLEDGLKERGFKGYIYHSGHTSMQHVNRNIKKDVTGKELIKSQPGNTEKRLEVLANDISKQIQGKQTNKDTIKYKQL